MADFKSGAGPCVPVAKGGVGESGATCLLHHRVTDKISKNMVLRNMETSLCGNTGAVAVLVINGEPVAHGIITKKGSTIQAEAQPGDNVIALIHTIPLFNEIVCVRLGELEVQLDECDFVG